MRRARRSLLLLLMLVLAVAGAGSLWVWQAKRQYALNRQLIDALVRHDNKAALALVQQGADPNTRQEAAPAPTLPQLFRQLLRRSPPVANDSSTALHFACGYVEPYWRTKYLTAPLPPDDAPLVQAMLTHGADVQATNEDQYTALYCAVTCHRPRSAQLLLNYGANVNAPSKFGLTLLMLAASSNDVDTTRRLLEHGASVTAMDESESRALHYAITENADSRILGILLAHGADPNARDKTNETPLHMAQQRHRSDLVTLLRKYQLLK